MGEPTRKRWCADWCPYSPEPYVLVKVADHKERWEAMRREAQEDAARVARALVDRFGAERVWLFGSTAGVWVFTEWSDIDLVVEGVEVSWRLREALSPLTRFPLDLWRREELRIWHKLIPSPILLAERLAPCAAPPEPPA